MNTTVMLVALLIIIIANIVLRVVLNGKRDDVAQRLTQYLVHKEYDKFDELVDSKEAKRVIPSYNLAYFKLNKAIQMNKDQEVDQLMQEIGGIKMSNRQKEELYLRVYNYYVFKHRKQKAVYYLTKIKEEIKDEGLILYCTRLYDIEILKKDDLLNPLLEELEDLSGQQQVWDLTLVSLIYKNQNNEEKAMEYANKAKRFIAQE